MGHAETAPAVRNRRELRHYQYGAFVLAAIALGVGAALLPRGDELLLIHVKNRDIERARAMLAGTAGGRLSSAASVVAHDELYLLEGRVDEALGELEAYAAARPDDVEAWSRLARMYEDAQRLDDEIRAAANVYRLAPTGALARRLATLYRWTGDEAREATMLHELVAGAHASAAQSLRSARLDAALGESQRAYDTLDRLRLHEPGAFDYPALELYASLHLALHGTGRLALPIWLLPIAQTDPTALAELARTFTSWGRPDAAVALFEPLPGTEASPVRLAMRARAAAGTSEAPRVAREMASLDVTRPLAEEPLAALVDLLLSTGDYETAISVLANPIRPPPPALVAAVIGHAVSHEARPAAQALIARVGDASLSDSPMLAAELAVERGDGDRAERWIGAMDATGQPTPEQQAALARFEWRIGLTARAFERLAALTAAGEAPPWVAGDLASLAGEAGRVEEGLRLLAATGSEQSRSAWVGLALTAGRARLVEAWLLSPDTVAAGPVVLRDTYFLLADRGERFLASMAAERLFETRGTPADALLLGQALVAAGRPADAVVALRRAAPASLEARLAYDGALLGALRDGADVAAELRRVFLARLGDPDLPADHRPLLVDGLWDVGERVSLAETLLDIAGDDLDRWLSPLVEAAVAAGVTDRAARLVAAALDADGSSASGDEGEPVRAETRRVDRVRALMALDAPDALLLPHLRAMADDVGGTWIYAYDARLERRSEVAERTALWAAVGRSDATPPSERRAAASRLVELGAQAAAAGIYEDLAAWSGPADPDVLQLLSLWGPRPGEAGIDWLMGRLASSPPSDRAAWMTHVVQAGGARRVVAAMPTLSADAAPEVIDAWIGAHEAADDASLVRGLRQVLGRSDLDIGPLRHAGRAALAHGLPDLAMQAYDRIAARVPDDRESLRWLGSLAFEGGHRAVARKWLAAYDAAGGDEPAALYQLGELARDVGEAAPARQYFARALARLEGGSEVVADAALLANVLVRLDERERAVAVFESVLREDPDLEHVRADFGAALIEWGDFGRARRILQSTPPAGQAAGAAAPADASSARRLDLLRVQLLSHDGRYAEALAVLETLAARFPTDPDVLLARAGFDAGRGRPAEADAGFERARLAAPQREDIDRIVEERARVQAPRVSVEAEQRTISDGWDERSERVSIGGEPWAHAPVSLLVERRRVSAPLVRLADGRAGALDAVLSRLEASAAARLGAGTTLSGIVFGTSGGVGAGVRLSHEDLGGRSELTAEVNRPFWDFLELAAADGRRDRIGLQRQWRLRADTAAWALGGWNRYRVASGDEVQSVGLTLGIVHTVRRAAPTITLQYGLDKEHRLRASAAAGTDGTGFVTIPLVSREVHLVGAISRFALADLWDVEVAGGYTIDRLGGRGSFASVRLMPPPAARAGLEFWADRQLYSVATSQRVYRAGARLTVRF